MEKNNKSGQERSGEYRAKVLTISDSRFKLMRKGTDKDKSGWIIQEKLEELDISSTRKIIPDNRDMIKDNVLRSIKNEKTDLIITTGGTGITLKDVTYETVSPLLEKTLPGFGETLRRKGYERVGGLGILTRAIAGISRDTPVICLPGPPDSIRIGMDILKGSLKEIIKKSKKIQEE
ncbi:MAG: molybdenum cofactor biosynthesis protein B [Candidatus Hadarchaeia archaeon]